MRRTFELGGVVLLVVVLVIAQPRPTQTFAPTMTAPAALDDLQGQVNALRNRVDNQQTQITTLEDAVRTQQSALTALLSEVDTLKTLNADLQQHGNSMAAKLQFVSVEGTEMFITGANLNIRNGSGSTTGTSSLCCSIPPAPNGLGNLIIGYNEGDAPRNGSHNLVVGPLHTYTSVGGVVAGLQNTISAQYATVTGGRRNSASGLAASVSGGGQNVASDEGTSITGGLSNQAVAQYSSVSGGEQNAASDYYASVSGGAHNLAGNVDASVSGGSNNTVQAIGGSVVGGAHNYVGAILGAILGGVNNTIQADAAGATIIGGHDNVAAGAPNIIVPAP